MKKLVSIVFFLVFYFCNAQVLYVDPVTSVALGLHGKEIKKGQEEQNEKLSQLEKAQTFVASQLVIVNEIQNKVYKGLREVNGTLSNGLQVKSIYENLATCQTYLLDITHIVKRHPQYAIFGEKATRKAYQRILKIGSDVSEIVTSSDTNLATAGDRYKLLFSVNQNVRMLRVHLATIRARLDYVEMVGIWKAINPFQGYIDTDRSIVENIMHKYRRF